MRPFREFLTPAQLKSELERCVSCEEKPCREACPANCSPADFVMAARVGRSHDYKRAAAIILASNPLGGICGSVCPDTHCMKACSRKTFDHPIEIPAVQATIICSARLAKSEPTFAVVPDKQDSIAIIGAGPAGLGAAATLSSFGYPVTLFDSEPNAGGMCRWIPEFRLSPEVLQADIEFVLRIGSIKTRFGIRIDNPVELLKQDYRAVIITTGLESPLKLGIPGEEHCLDWKTFLQNPNATKVAGKKVVVIGGGAIAVDVAATASKQDAQSVTMITLERFDELPLTVSERDLIHENSVELIGRTRVDSITQKNGKVAGVLTSRVVLPSGKRFHPASVQPIPDDPQLSIDCDCVIVAIGARSSFKRLEHDGLFYAGDFSHGPSTVVEAVASGKNSAASVMAWIQNETYQSSDKPTKSQIELAGRQPIPVPLECEFFGRKIASPFILSAAPPTDGYDQVAKAYRTGWSGAVMKTAFDDVPIHIPGEYMFVVNESTYANCDNVSGHPLNRVCEEINRLVTDFPDKLTIGSTGGPVTGNDHSDCEVWQSNTRKLEAAGAMAVEYSLSCPQGGDGTKGDIVSQDAELTAKIVDWVMECSRPDIPKLFKLTGAVTAIVPIVQAIKKVFDRYPGKQAGITLANSFPALQFRAGEGTWDDGYIVGLSGAGISPISNLTLAKVTNCGVTVSGNGGPMDYYSAAHFLALGVTTVQFCTIALKYGVHVIDELHSGLSHLLEARGFSSVEQFIGCAAGSSVVEFGRIPAVKKISAVEGDLCQHCGNCSRCPYLAIELDANHIPVTDAARCIGCSLCVQKCFSGALYMRPRTAEESAVMVEA